MQRPQELQLHDANFLLRFPFSQEERESQQVRSILFPKIILAALLQGHTLSAIQTAADFKAALRNSKKLEIPIAAPAVPPESALSPKIIFNLQICGSKHPQQINLDNAT